MSPSLSSSQDTVSNTGDELRIEIGVDPDSSAYAPDMDSLETNEFSRIRGSLKGCDFLALSRFTHDGDKVRDEIFTFGQLEEIEDFLDDPEGGDIYLLAIPETALLNHRGEMREIYQKLRFAPLIPYGPSNDVLRGLGRRLYGSCSQYDLWFTLPLMNPALSDNVPGQDLHVFQFDTDSGYIHLRDSMGMFYLSFDIETRQTRVLYSNSIPANQKLEAVSENAEDLDVRNEPFMFLTCALSAILENQGNTACAFFAHIKEMEHYTNSLEFEIAEDEEKQVKETAIKLRKSLPDLERILELVECAIQIIEDTISEHKDCKDLLLIPEERFLYVEKNLQTLRSKAISFKTYQETRIRRINVCLSTLSSLLSLRADSAIKASTEAMKRLTEANREDSGRMNEIAIATKLDSEAMITIAKLTMFYLPSTFVATLFSMGIFNFDFDNGKNGRLVMSSQWWMYIIFAIPLTLGTFYWFRAVTRSHKQASQKAEREAKQPE
ncbi:hypothetical protein FNAPI_3536 [Fusarium napiforme]|uniref:Uncharacterized protein n=1 Tax=Fusarium napiforme TaxID=42672 RepID=A0A8H5JVT7_9HYPO|nr:hypothetical protein FNAPI_3536 [Fusarium napiforme]